MPPNLDVYVLVSPREERVVQHFLDRYVDVPTSADRGDEELMILPVNANREPARFEDWDWAPAESLDAAIRRGLTQPWRAFRLYLEAREPYSEAILSFTSSGHIVLGLSIDDEHQTAENLDTARSLLHAMADEFGSARGFVGWEVAPPLLVDEFPPQGEPRVLYEWSRETA